MSANFVAISAESVVKALIQGRQSERMEAQRCLQNKTSNIDLGLARQLILDALNGRYAPRLRDDSGSGVRCWLVSSLALVPSAGGEPEQTLLRFLDEQHEWSAWVRYWALQAMLKRGAGDLESICRNMLSTDTHILPRSLAKAAVAATDDRECIEDIKQALCDDSGEPEDEKTRWAVLRALRFIYLPFAVESTAEIVNNAARQGTFNDVTFDAVVALGNVQRDVAEANVAANALMNIITRSREFQCWDVLRIRAIEALGNLRINHTSSLLLDEATDLNPSVAKQAVLALEQVLDAETMTGRILERLANDKAPEGTLTLYANALRCLTDHRPAVNKLESAMASGPIETREYARRLLSEMGGSYAVDKLTAQAQGAQRYLQVLDDSDQKIRDLFEETLLEGRRGFHIVTVMDITLFVVGLAMLALAIGFATVDKQLIAVLTASGGILSTLYGRFFAKPREQVETAVTRLAALKAIFLGYLRQLRQIDQTYARRMLDDEAPNAAEVRDFVGLVETVMNETLTQLGTHRPIRRVERGPKGMVEAVQRAPTPEQGQAAAA